MSPSLSGGVWSGFVSVELCLLSVCKVSGRDPDSGGMWRNNSTTGATGSVRGQCLL